VGLLAKLAIAVLERTNPKLTRWARNVKALDWAEKYIFYNEDKVIGALDDERKSHMEREIRKLKWYRKQFFKNN